MRFSVLVALACTWFAALGVTAAASPPTSLDVSAKNVDFYYNRFIVTADGSVRVRLSDGTTVSGETFTMDLKLNRYLVAGDVHVDGPTIHQRGAAFAGYPDLDRSFFLPVGETPERYTYFGLDWTNPHPGHEHPGDAFYFPDLSGERAYIKAAGARIVPRTNVLFDQARVYTAGIYAYSPRYVVTFSANPHFFENAFAGARADVAVPFNGSAHSLTALHARNDAVNGTYLAIDQHFVWDHDYIVAAIDPLTQEQRQYNLIGYKRFSPKLESRLFLQESAAQAGIVNRPENAAAFGEIQLNGALRHSGLSYTQDNYYQYILGYPRQANDAVAAINYDPRWREHPTQTALIWTGYENRLLHGLPLTFRLRSGVGTAHDVYGYGGYPNLNPPGPDLFYHTYGGTLSLPALKFANGLSLTAVYDRQQTWFSQPHHTDISDARVSLAKQYALQHVNAFLLYDVKNTGDYWGAQQLAAFPVGVAAQTGCAGGGDTCVTPFGTYRGLDAFRGFATSRGLSGSLVFTPSPLFTMSLLLSHYSDFPKPVPGVFGQPPWQFTGDLRVRLSKQVLLDVARSNYFNFANERWTPQFQIQFSP